jgi:hypothetical protein
MTLRALHELQDAMFRAYVRNVMFFATLPHHLAEGAGSALAHGDLARVELDRSPPANRHDDPRLLR